MNFKARFLNNYAEVMKTLCSGQLPYATMNGKPLIACCVAFFKSLKG